MDHGIFRLAYLNAHRLGDRAWRSAQPAPHNIRAFARLGIRTIVNLRGRRCRGSYELERGACERHRIALVDFRVSSRKAPTQESIRAVRELFARVEYPVLIHCKSGADRTGLVSVLYRILQEREPVDSASRELSLHYGHLHGSDAGILDAFFARYIEDSRSRPMSFLDWVENVYDADDLTRTFRARRRTGKAADRLLRRA
jgi:protein tyrosine/serine phosphatase